MDWDFVWKAIVIVLVGTFLLRIAGRKTISQMTISETVILIAIGSLMIQPVSGKDLGTTFLVAGVLVVTLVLLQFLQMKSDGFEKLITGKAKIVIENGILNEKNLKKIRLSVDQLEMNLRQKNVTKISDVQYATLEPNGQIGFTLKKESQPVTQKEFQKISDDIQQLQLTLNNFALSYSQPVTLPKQLEDQSNPQLKQSTSQEDIFAEVLHKSHKDTPPKHLQ
ncbi:DUF421 domain-containing protein [Bacillus sp. DJP31]|uniref:DUF421 domain-containing protein n=1 Tax=Bacillus sp. DJP31 TaxID=3409789 RepID=UPI003BB6B661